MKFNSYTNISNKDINSRNKKIKHKINDKSLINYNNYDDLKKNNKKEIRKYLYCKRCGEKLINWKSKIWGYCAFCESL